MNNLNFYFTNLEKTLTPKANFSHPCPTKVKGLIWINNQPFWTHECLCGHYYFELGKTNSKWGGSHD